MGTYARTVVLTDDLGRSVAIETQGHRWISLAPHLTESFLLAGLQSRLIAVDSYSPKHPSLNHVKRLSGLIPHQPTLYRWSPTVVWVWYNSPASRLLALEREGVAVYYHRPKTMNAIPDFMEKLSPLVEDATRLKAFKSQWHNRVEALRKKYQFVRKLKVFHPFSWRPLLSFNRNHWISEALQLCAAVSITDGLRVAAPVIKPGYVKEQGTEVVLLAERETAYETVLAQKKAWQDAVPMLADIPVINIEPDLWHRPGPHFIDALETVCTKLDQRRAVYSE